MSFHDLAKRIAPKDLLEFANEHLKPLMASTNGIEVIMLCSSDGFELCTLEQSKIENKGKLAAVSSSIMAMVQALMHEIKLEGCQNITLEANNGKAILTSIPHPKYPMLTITLTTKDVLLGHLLYGTKKIAQTISEYQAT